MAAAELKLQVGLDLAFFRQQLAQIGSVAVGYQLPINIKLDRLSIQQELDRLQRNINRRKYTIDLNDTSVASAADKVENLAAALKKLSGSIQIDFNAGGGTKPIGTAMKEMAAKLAKESKGDIDEAVKRMVGMRGAAPFGPGTRSISGFKAAAKGMDIESAFKLFFQELNQVDPQGLKKALDDGSVMMMQENREIKQKFDKIQSSAEGLAKDLRAMGEAAQVTGKASLSSGGKTLYPQNYGLKIASLLSQVEKLDKELHKLSAESGVELLDTLKELSSVLRTTSNSFAGITGFSNTLDATLKGFDAATKAAARATNAYAERIRRRGGIEYGEYGPSQQKLLPGRTPGGALAVRTPSEDPYKVIQVQVRNAFNIIEDYHKQKINNFKDKYKEVIAQYHRNVLASAARSNVRGGFAVADLGTNKPLLTGTSYPALPAAGETGKNRVRISTGDPFQSLPMLPPAGGTTPRSQMPLHAVSTGAYVGQPGFMQAPSIPPPMGGGGAPPAPPTPPGGGRGGRGGGMGAFPNISLPGAGLISELGGEFAMAAKQVLLFGTAYKALAFLTDFPSKVGEAVGQLQTFRNTLQAITPNANEFQQSNQFILDTVAKYNTPLQSARDGFTNLYASMAPAGFKGDEIRNIFSGISQGAATFGMSADKVDRVNYAFAQMASKGQVMSEELKGQLGDVLPGAVAIFAKAAGFTGPNAMVEFTKAMEAGRYKGEAMKQLLINVGIVMQDKFAKGAEGAAQNFQGQMNAMANATKKLYEAFEPAGNLFSSKVIAPFTEGLTVITDGFSAFFTGVATKTAGGFALSQELEKLRPTFQGLSENVKQFLPLLQSFASTALGLAKVLLQIASNPFVGYLARIYAIVLPLNIALSVMRGLWASNAIQLLVLNARLASGTSMLTAFRSMMAATGATSAATAATIRGAFATTGVGLILVGLGLLIERFASMNQKLMDMKSSALGAAEAIRRMSQAEARQEENKASKDVKTLEALLSKKNKGATAVPITDEQQQALERAGVRTGRMALDGTMAAPGSAPDVFKYTQKAVDVTQIQSALLARKGIASEASYRVKQLKFDEVQSQQQLPPIPGATGDGSATRTPKAARIPLEQLLDRGSSRAAQSKAAALDLALNERILQAKKDGNEAEEASLENLRPVIKARGELAALTEFHNMLIKNEAKIVGKSLTQAQFKERLQLAGQKMTLANIGLENANVDLKKKEFEEGRKILEQQQEYLRTLEDIKIKNGEMSDEDIRRIEKLRQYQDILKANPNLTEVQKTDLFNAVNAAPVDIIGEKLKAYRKNLDDMLNTKNQIVGIAESIGDSFGTAFKGIITGSMTAQEALAGFFQNLSNYFADMVTKMIAEYLKMQVIEGIMNIFSMFSPGLGSGIAPGPVAKSAGVKYSATKMGPAFANGGIAYGGFQAFASGGIVTGPTMGLVGEGRYNEAVIPLPDGKSVPVDLMGVGGGTSGPVNVVVNVDAKGSTVEGDKDRAGDLGRAISAAVQSELIKQQRPGGILSGPRR